MFGEIAPRYDLLNHLLSANVDRYWRWRTVRSVAPSGSAPILDLCTGTGDLALAYARVADPSTPILGADFCRPMLVRGRGKASGRVQFVEADATRLPFDDDRFQIVSVAFGLRNVVDADACLREMARVCRPGGRVVVLEFSLPTAAPLRIGYQWYFRHVLPRIGQALARNANSAYEYLPASVQAFPSREALAARLTAAGLRGVRYASLTLGVATLYVGSK